MGFSSSNDRAIIPVLKRLDFLTDDGTPTDYYDRLKDPNDHPFVLGERIMDLYKDVYAIHTEIHKSPDKDIKGAIARVTGKDEKTVGRYFTTFKTLASLAKFGASPKLSKQQLEQKPDEIQKHKKSSLISEDGKPLSFQYNIEIHLPATTDVSVYNAIFKSLRENLLE
jgi:hypothetical protein